ncbi:ankyrin repeat domain-containing protein 31 [Psammomys obesus]|uniref:ankyrin repeat domain-containing protein 31 n=1 Tax=Psammomys obesus TaxID=48139 RepID=UPI002452D09B|nr:ankyrin repeat domain-containing protein 31 [Psammomys obesus]
MEKGSQVSDSDSDETVIEGSVTENELEDEELPWRSLFLNQDTTYRFESCLHPGINGICKGMPSPEIHLGSKQRKDYKEQKSKDEALLAVSEDPVLQDLPDETTQNQVLLQTREELPALTVSFPHPEVSWSHQNTEGPEAENCENLPHPEKELSENIDSPEISLLSGTSLMASDLVALKEKSLPEPVKTLAVTDTFSEPGEEVTLTMTSKETKDEEKSLETFVSAIESLLESSGGTQEETLLEIMNDFSSQDLLNPLSNSLNSVSGHLNALSACYKDVQENMKDVATLPADFLATTNTLPGAGVGPVCQEQEKSSCVSGGNECLQVQPTMSQIDEDCTQIEQTLEDAKLFKLQTLTHENATSYEQLNNKGNSDLMKNASIQETPQVLRRSSRLEKLKASRDVMLTVGILKMPERISSETLSYDDQMDSTFTTENFSNRKNMHSSSIKSEHVRKKKQLRIKNDVATGQQASLISAPLQKCVPSFQRRLEMLLRCKIPLHEASVGGYYQTVSELLMGGVDVNVKGKYQITLLHDVVRNRHYKVAELILLNGVDSLFKNDHGTCALDEAKDSHRRRSTGPAYVEDVFQYKKPKLSFNNYTESIFDEKINGQEPRHVEFNKGSNSLLENKEYVHEHCQKISNTTNFGDSKPRRSTVNQVDSTELRRNNLHNVKDSRTNVSENKGQRNMQHIRTQVHDIDCNLSQAIAISSFGSMQQHTVQTLYDLPEESCELSTPTLRSLKNGFCNNEVFKKSNTQILDLSDSQEMQFLELESVDQTETASFSELSSYKEIKSPHVTTDQQPHTNQAQSSSPFKSPENNSSDEKDKSSNKWENSFLSFIKGRSADSDSDNDCRSSDKSVTSQKEGTDHCHHEERLTQREVDSQHLSSENYFSQENELKVGGLTTQPQREAFNSCDSNNTLISEKHIPVNKNCTYGTSFDHSSDNTEQSSMPCTRLPSTQKVSPLSVEVELLKAFQDNVPTLLVNQADTQNVEKKQDTERDYTVKGQIPSSSNSPLPTAVHSQVIEITKGEKRRPDLPGIMNNLDFHSPDNVNKELANSLQLNQGKEKPHKSDEDVTNNASRAEKNVKYCKQKKEKMDCETQMLCDAQEHRKDQNSRKTKSSLKAHCSQEVNRAGINKRNAKGESQLHVASRRGNLSVVKVLIESGADVNLKDYAGWTPLHEASNKGFEDVIMELLKAGANVNCENIDGILPLHDAVVGNHLKAAEILLEHGADPNQKDQKQKSALEEAKNENMKELLKSYGAVETNNGDDSNSTVTVKIPAVRPKRYKQSICKDDKAIGSPPLQKAKGNESLPERQTISAILQDIEEKQENLLKFELRNSEDAEQYIGKMLEIKEVMDNILAQQKTERDDLAKKYRVSMESFKHGALREQLANLATRQKSLLVVAKKQKKIRLKIQNYKNATSLSGISVRKLPCSSDISSEKNQEPPSVENLAYPQPSSFSPVSLAYRSVQQIPLSLEIQSDSQNTNICLNTEAMRREEFSGNEINSKQNVQDCILGGLLKFRHSDSPEKITLSSQPAVLTPQIENIFTETTVKGNGFDSSPSITGTINISENKSIFSQNDACSPAVPQNQDLLHCNPKRRNKKTASQQPSGGIAEPLAPQVMAVLDTETVHQTKPHLKKTASVASHANSIPISPSSVSAQQHSTKKASPHSPTPRKKNVQLKDLILCGRINPGNNVLEFKTQLVLHVLFKNYLAGTSRKSMQSIPHYLQIKEILLITDQELLPCHIMEQHWKFYVECKKLTF